MWATRRAWRCAGTDCIQLTQDHAFEQPDQRSRLTRAVGLDDAVRVDFVQGELRVGDCLPADQRRRARRARGRRAGAAARARGDVQDAADAIVTAAWQAGSTDNATALVLRVSGLDAARLEDADRRRRRLPAAAALPRRRRVDGLHDHRAGGRHRRSPPVPGARRPRRRRWWRSRRCTKHAPATRRTGRCWCTRPGWRSASPARDDARLRARARAASTRPPSTSSSTGTAVQTLEQMLRKRVRRFEVAEIVAAAIAIAARAGPAAPPGRDPSRRQAGQPAPRRRRAAGACSTSAPRCRAARALPRASCTPARRAT